MLSTMLIYAAISVCGFLLLSYVLRYAARKLKFLLPSKKIFLQNVLRALTCRGHGFDGMIGLEDAQILGYENGELTAQIKISINLCMASCMAGKAGNIDLDAKGEIGVGAVLALADVFTSLVLLAGDSNHRPGVSITLTGELFKSITVGQIVTVKARILKIGSNLGFLEMWLHDEAGEPLARAKHIKYLPMGAIFDLYGFLLPAIVNLYNYKNSSKVKSAKKEAVAAGSSASELSATFGGCVLKKASQPVAWYQTREKKELQNFYGFMHGGAICCLLELCILDSFRETEMFPPLPGSTAADSAEGSEQTRGSSSKTKIEKHGSDPLRYLEVSFLSPCKGSLEVGIEHHALGEAVHSLSPAGAAERPVGCLAGKIYAAKDKKKARLLVEASYSY